MKCYCCSGEEFGDCCDRFLKGAAKPVTAEELMRSRFSAFATGAIDYLIMSVHPSNREFHRPKSVGEFSRVNKWLSLEIVDTVKGAAKDREGIVEFRAHFEDPSGAARIHHERSRFKKELGKWFFVDGDVF